MDLKNVQFIFNRALSLTFIKKKLLLTFSILAFCGVLVVFFRGLAANANHWMILSLTFLPIFLCSGVMLSLGIFLIRIYHDEIKGKLISYRTVLSKSWEVIISASYFAIPIILSYLLLWILLGVFVMLGQIPGLGNFFSVILIFGPFLINFGSLLLCVVSLSMLFFIAPIIALKGLNRSLVSQTMVKRAKLDLFTNVTLGFIALLPLAIILGLLVLAGVLTDAVCYACDSHLLNVLQWFFMMIPFTAILAPAVIFFFNFAAESHVLLMKDSKGKSES